MSKKTKSVKTANELARELRDDDRVDSATVEYFGKSDNDYHLSGNWDAVAVVIKTESSFAPVAVKDVLSSGEWIISEINARGETVTVEVWAWT